MPYEIIVGEPITKLDYLKKVIMYSTMLEYKEWYMMCFSIPVLKETEVTYPLESSIYLRQDGMYFIDTFVPTESVTIRKILDWKKGLPLFDFREEIEVDGTWMRSIPGKMKTIIGRLLVNKLVLFDTLGEKVGYLNEKFSVKKIEAILSSRVANKGEEFPGSITVKQMIECIDRLNYLRTFAMIINRASSPKTITGAPGINKAREKLLEENKDSLTDPVKVIQIENELAKLENEYLADDVVAANTFTKKIMAGRKRMYVSMGGVNDFGGKENTILAPLSEGIRVTKKDFPNYVNDLRYGSHSRGSSTALSGYTYKILQRSLAGLVISPNPCNTTKGYKRAITKNNVVKLVGRYIKVGNKWELVSNLEEANKYIDKVVEFRSTMYCSSPKNTVCYTCMSELYKNSPSGVTNIAANISSALMSAFLKIMHSSTKELVEIRREDLIT